MKKITQITIIFMCLCYSSIFAAPNDLCSTANSLSVSSSCSNTLVTFDGTETDSGVVAPSCGNYIGGDLWYQFIMPSTGGVEINTSIDDGSIIDVAVAVYIGADCNNLSLYQCVDRGGFENLFIVQPAGSTIFLRVWEYNNLAVGSFNICVIESEPASNDDCFSAIDLTVSSTCNQISGTNFGATDSESTDATIPTPGCGNYLGGDVWFRLVVPASGDVSVETFADSNIIDGSLAIYSGTCDPNGLVLISCADDEYFEYVEITDRTPGEILFVRFWSFSNAEIGTFNICAVELIPLGINENSMSSFNMFPNPAKGEVTFNFEGWNANMTLGILDIQGKLIVNQKLSSDGVTLKMDVSSLTSGLYFVQLISEGRKIVKKLIIE